MNKANFTFFHLKESRKTIIRAVSSLFLFFSLFAAINVSAQTLSCNGHLNVSVDPESCEVVLDLLTLETTTNGEAILIEGIDDDYMDGNGSSQVTIYADEVPAFREAGMIMDVTYNVIIGDVDDPTNSCWGTLTLEDKAAPMLEEVLPGTSVCSEFPDHEWEEVGYDDDDDGYERITNECTDVEVSYRDEILIGQCEQDTALRHWTVTDVKGNVATTTDTLFLTPETLDNLTLPDDYDDLDKSPVYTVTVNGVSTDVTYSVDGVEPLSCDGNWNPEPADDCCDDRLVPSPWDNGLDEDDEDYLHGTGVPGGVGTCGTIHATYENILVDICDSDCEQNQGSFKVLRQWTILDWCEGNVLEHNQIIKVLDTEAPEIETPDNITVSTDLWGCTASVDLPEVEVSDNCSEEIDVWFETEDGTVLGNDLSGLEKTMNGPTLVYVYAADCCDNTAVDHFYVTVVDEVPPVVVADAHTVVSLSDYEDRGLAKVHVSTFDDGSFDGCGPIGMWARRMLGDADENACVGEKDGESFLNEDGDIDSTSGFDDLWFKYIHFCCEDVNLDDDGNEIPIMVEFLVCDDADMDGEPEYNGDDNCNTAMVEVFVQDKLPPACLDIEDEDINCIDFVAFQDYVNIGTLSAEQAQIINENFGYPEGAATCNVLIEQSLSASEDCGEGQVTRTIKVTNTVNGLSTTCSQTIYVEVDDDRNFLVCEDITFPAGSAEDDLYRDYIKSKYGTTSDYYPNYVWCLMNPDGIGDYLDDGEDLPAIEVDDCGGVTITAPEIDIDDLCSEVGINLTLDTFDFAGGGCKKILAHWEIIDQCLFVENYLYYNGDEYEINPFVPENGYFEMYVEYDLFDTEGPEITCGAGEIVGCTESLQGPITATATDNCTDPAYFGWSWKLDVDFGEGTDGVADFEGEGYSVSPGDIGLTSFPEGEHAITWIVNDGCGNITTETCTFPLEIADQKSPTPYCYDGLSSAVMDMSGEVEIWAEDFNVGSFDDCSDVTVTIIRDTDAAAFDTDDEAHAAATDALTFTCADLSENGVAATLDIRMYATDAAGNYDYCLASFRLLDNTEENVCPDSEGALAAIGGNVATEDGQMVDEVTVEAMAANPEFPKYTTTGSNGEYAFYNNPSFYSYEITPERNMDFDEGVTTLDIVLIQKHILNIESLDSPYKLIAADVNNDGSIKASDLLQLRKLILGVYSDDRLPSNNSWRFVDANFQFADEANPWPFAEVALINELSADEMSENFVAMKVGDVNNSIQMSATNATVRNNKELTFELNDASFAAGEKVEMNFRSSDFSNVYGYQFTLEFSKDLNFAGIEAGALDLTEANFGLNRIAEGVITTSFDAVRGVSVNENDVLFTITFVANEAVELKDVVNISSKVTAAEAYTGAGLDVNNVNLAFRSGEGVEVANTYALYQNEPNPFRGITNVSFNLPEAAEATISVFDVTGKVLYRSTADYAKGLNTVRIDNINTSGVLYYQLDSDDFTATKKMIVIE